MESPLKRRTLTKEETDQIHFNRHDLKPNLYVNRVSSVIWSYPLQFMQFRLDLDS